MLLVDWQIKNAIEKDTIHLEPFDESLLQPNSYDVRLGDHFIVYCKSKHSHSRHIIDPYNVESIVRHTVSYRVSDYIVIEPGDFVLGRTQEIIGLPDDIAAKIDGKSSIARLGIVVHQTGGFIDAGFCGTITLEISNANSFPVKLYVGMPIAQIEFHQTEPAQRPYNKKEDAKYMKQIDATISKFYQNSKKFGK